MEVIRGFSATRERETERKNVCVAQSVELTKKEDK